MDGQSPRCHGLKCLGIVCDKETDRKDERSGWIGHDQIIIFCQARCVPEVKSEEEDNNGTKLTKLLPLFRDLEKNNTVDTL